MTTEPNCYWRIKGSSVWTPAWAMKKDCGLVEIQDTQYSRPTLYSLDEIEIKWRTP